MDSTSPPDSGPPRHVHHAEDETFVILPGRCRIWSDGEERIASAGETVFIPRGKEHSFKVTGEAPCRQLVILTPAASRGSSPTWPRASSPYRRTWPPSRNPPSGTTSPSPARR
nr:cupin domain-containing protein [Jannaschia seohaensis]